MRVVSGIQPTGNLHLGNYLGRDPALGADAGRGGMLLLPGRSPRVTVYNDPAELTRNVREMAAR
jgi:tryptophanyl-tRNA synthetase